MTKTPATFPNSEIPEIIYETGTKCPKTEAEITYLNNNNIDEAIFQKLKKKAMYETEIHKIYNIVVGHKMSNYRRRQYWDPPSRRSRQSNTPLGT